MQRVAFSRVAVYFIVTKVVIISENILTFTKNANCFKFIEKKPLNYLFVQKMFISLQPRIL